MLYIILVSFYYNQIKTSSVEVLKNEKKKTIRLEDMSKKQRRAAEYRIMREAETKSSQFITKYHVDRRK